MARESKPRLLLLGLDGADWQVIRPLMEAGELPFFKHLCERGATGNLATLQPAISPILWNSIATGKRASAHGVHGFAEVDPETGKVRPVTGASRRCRALWNILQLNGGKPWVLNWFAGHPAEALNGGMCSPFFFEPRPSRDAWPVPPQSIYPASLAEPFSEYRLHPTELDSSFADLFIRDFADIDQDLDERVGQWAVEMARSISIHTTAMEIVGGSDWDFGAFYFRTPDLIGHLFMPFHPPRQPDVPESLFHHYQDVVAASYRFLDHQLAQLYHRAGADTNYILLSDHGFKSGQERPAFNPNPFGTVEDWHREQGIFAAIGPAFQSGVTIAGANLLDIAPTVLHLSGLAVGRDMNGRVLVEALAETASPQFIDSWETVDGADGRMGVEASADTSTEASLLQQFIALGYLPPEVTQGAAGARRVEAENRWNLARDLIDAGSYEAALPLLETERFSSRAEPERLFLLAQCQWQLRLLEEAKQTASDLLRLVPQGPGLQRILGQIAAQKNDSETALKHYHAALQRSPDPARVLTLIAQLHARNQDFETALGYLEKALKINPENAGALLCKARVHLRRDDASAAVDAALLALESERSIAESHLILGKALLRLEKVKEAQVAFETALAYRPGFIPAHAAMVRLARRYQLGYFVEMEHQVALMEHFRARETPAQRLARLRAGIHERTATPGSSEFDSGMKVSDQAIIEEKWAVDSPFASDSTTEDSEVEGASPVMVVSGLPRSGTSLMMQILRAWGHPVKTSADRPADTYNPRGYEEWDAIRFLQTRPNLLGELGGTAVKIVTPLLTSIPPDVPVRILYMTRDYQEIAQSQNRMNADVKAGAARELESGHLAVFEQKILRSLQSKYQDRLLLVSYRKLIETPAPILAKVAAFLDLPQSTPPPEVFAAIDPALYRNRVPAPATQ